MKRELFTVSHTHTHTHTNVVFLFVPLFKGWKYNQLLMKKDGEENHTFTRSEEKKSESLSSIETAC